MSRDDMTRRTLLGRASGMAAGLTCGGLLRAGSAGAAASPPTAAYAADVAAEWFDLELDLVRTTPGYSPPVAARAFGYAGVTLYEAVAPGTARRSGLAGVLNGLDEAPVAAAGAYHWPTVASSALASLLRGLFPTAPPASLQAIADLEQRHSSKAMASVPRGIHQRSVARGAAIAQHVFAWSAGDGGHGAFARNFPPYEPPVGPGLWQPTPPAHQSALQPFWGSNRPLALHSATMCDPGPPPAYSEEPGTRFHDEATECYAVATGLTAEQIAIARFWSDDPGATATPPGHSLSILTQVVRLLGLDLGRAAEAYAKVGIAVSDAFVACWRTKFEYNLLRPVTCLRAVIDPAWSPLLVTPPFPEYTSGHSVQSAAAAEVLGDLFGKVAFVDHTHDRRGLAPRAFASFAQAAQEAAISRLYGGIHFRSAIEQGLVQGRCIGRHVSGLF